MFHPERTRRDQSRFDITRTLSTLILVLLIGTAPAFATDPEEIDPDPNFASQEIVVEIVVSDPADMASLDLPPGRYTVWILAADGSVEVFHFVVAP